MTPRGPPSIIAPSPSRCATCSSSWAPRSRSWSPSTTSSGSMRPRRPRSPLRCAGCRQAMFSCCSPGGCPTAPQSSRLEDALPPPRSSGCRWGRSASGPCTGCCAIGSAPASRGRPCSVSGSSRAETRSSRSSWRGPWARTSARWTRSRSRRPSKSCWAPGSLGCPARPSRRWRSSQRSARPRSRCSSGLGIEGESIQPAVEAHVIERVDGSDPVHPSASGVGRVPRPRRAAVARSREIARAGRGPLGPCPSPCAVEGPSRMPMSQPCSTTR